MSLLDMYLLGSRKNVLFAAVYYKVVYRKVAGVLYPK